MTHFRPTELKEPPLGNPNCRRRSAAVSGFTRTDLLAVILLAGFALSLQVPAFGNSRTGSQAGICLSNLRRLTTAWTQFAHDNSGALAGNTWIASSFLDYTGTNSDNTNTLKLVSTSTTQLGAYTQNPMLYKCPADSSWVRITNQKGSRILPRVRSYSMNTAMNLTGDGWLPSPPYRMFRKLSDIVAPIPSQAFVFIEEHQDSINDGDFAVQMPGVSLAKATFVDVPAGSHDRSGALAFADGHAELHTWQDVRTVVPVRREEATVHYLPGANNQDIRWLSDRTSSLRN